MNNQLQVFKNEEFGEVRILLINDEPWFVGKDVAEKLGYKNVSDALKKRVDAEDKGIAKCDTLGGTQEMTIINESGLYSLILSSKLPNAKKFKKWVTGEVLPSLRKTGKYDSIEQQIQAIEDETEKNLKLTIYSLQKIVEMNPADIVTGMMLESKKNELTIYLQSKEIKVIKDTIANMVVIGDRKQFTNEVNAVARASSKQQSEIYSLTYKLLKDDYGIDLNARVRNKKEQLQNERLEQGKKPLSPSTLKSKVNALVVADEENLWRELGICLYEVKNNILQTK